MELLPHFGWRYKNGCTLWKSDMGKEYLKNFETIIPTVIVQSTWDTSTPYENALELIPYFKDSKLITVHRGLHSTIRQSLRHYEDFKISLFQFAKTGDFSALPTSLEIPVPTWVLPISN